MNLVPLQNMYAQQVIAKFSPLRGSGYQVKEGLKGFVCLQGEAAINLAS